MFRTHKTFNLSTGLKSPTIAVVNTTAKVFVVYHSTIVCEATPKTVTLRDGGWDTISTRYVINTALERLGVNQRVIRHKNRSLICPINYPGEYPHHKAGKPFVSGMKLARGGAA